MKSKLTSLVWQLFTLSSARMFGFDTSDRPSLLPTKSNVKPNLATDRSSTAMDSTEEGPGVSSTQDNTAVSSTHNETPAVSSTQDNTVSTNTYGSKSVVSTRYGSRSRRGSHIPKQYTGDQASPNDIYNSKYTQSQYKLKEPSYINAYKPEKYTTRVSELITWANRNTTNRIGAYKIGIQAMSGYIEKLHLLLTMDKDIGRDLQDGLEQLSWEEYMKGTYRPLFNEYRDIMFQMEEQEIRDLFEKRKFNETFERRKRPAYDDRGTFHYDFVVQLMFDRFYFSSAEACDLSVAVAKLFLKITGKGLTKEEEEEFNRRFVNSGRQKNKGRHVRTKFRRREIRKIRKTFSLGEVMDRLKEYYEFVKGLGRMYDGTQAYLEQFREYDFPATKKYKLRDFDRYERNLLKECFDVFKGYLENVDGGKKLNSKKRKVYY